MLNLEDPQWKQYAGTLNKRSYQLTLTKYNEYATEMKKEANNKIMHQILYGPKTSKNPAWESIFSSRRWCCFIYFFPT